MFKLIFGRPYSYTPVLHRIWDIEADLSWDEMDPECPAFLRKEFNV